MEAARTIKGDLQKAEKEPRLRALLGSSLAQVCRAYDSLDDRLRILKGKPLPGSLRQSEAPRKSQRPTAGPATPAAAEKILDLPNEALG